MTSAPSASSASPPTGPGSDNHARHRLLSLPAELLLQCLGYLSPLDLVSVSESCSTLRKSALTDSLWQNHINANLATPIATPAPSATFRDLYVAHHHHWFLTRNRLWISDAEPSGKLILTSFNSTTGCIEAHTVVAERNEHTSERWSQDTNVLIVNFEPQVKIHTEAPVLKLALDSTKVDVVPSSGPHSAAVDPPLKVPSVAKEILMDCASANSPGLKTAFMLATDLPRELVSSQAAVWPPVFIPAFGRTRNLSPSDFSSLGHRPTSLSTVSQSTFRVRRWVDYHARRDSTTAQRFDSLERLAAAAGLGFTSHLPIPRGIQRRGGQVTTFGTIRPEAYTPTEQKPWRGIYCGDYSGHGCEFLVVLQPDAGHEMPLPQGANWLVEWFAAGNAKNDARQDVSARTYSRMNEILQDMAHRDGLRRRDFRTLGRTGELQPGDDEDEDEDEDTEWEDPDWEDPSFEEVRPPTERDFVAPRSLPHEPPEGTGDIYSGQLIAIKLTGDPHIPRGEISFIAPDLGDKGFVRTASDNVFRGSRVVRGCGHVANRGFRHDEYIPSQLILASHDELAMHWQPFSHVSFYKRVNLDALFATTGA